MGADFFNHVELPDNVRIGLSGQLLLFVRAVVLAVAEPLSIETNQLAAIRHIVESLSFDQRRRAHALIRPIINAARREFFACVLPEKLAVGFAKRHQYALVPGLFRIAKALVVGSAVDLSARDDRVAVCLRPERRNPLDVLFSGDVPTCRQAFHIRDHIPIWSAAPHWPIAAARIRSGTMLRSREDYKPNDH